MIADYVPEGAVKTAAMVKEAGGIANCIAADVSVPGQVGATVSKTVASFGRLDCAFNNAGIAGAGAGAHTANYAEEAFDQVIAINLKGVWLCMKSEIPQMLKVGAGAIVNTASAAGPIGLPGAYAYVAAKHGVVGLTRTAALEYAQKNIRVNCVCPGYIRTPMLERGLDAGVLSVEQINAMEPVGRMGTPEEIAEAVLWLMSDAASFVTGHPLSIDGGYIAR
jgi:NAD(P)-dependent dehydrogenase (short-subunit alcohol dehydrogenase family)